MGIVAPTRKNKAAIKAYALKCNFMQICSNVCQFVLGRTQFLKTREQTGSSFAAFIAGISYLAFSRLCSKFSSIQITDYDAQIIPSVNTRPE